jgi:hypothetical protein
MPGDDRMADLVAGGYLAPGDGPAVAVAVAVGNV